MKINHVYKDAFKSDCRYLVIKGSAGSGKSVFITQKIIYRVLTEENHRFLVVRKVGATLRNSVWQLFLDEIYRDNLANEFTINKSDFRLTVLRNGNQVIFCGVDDPEKIKSIAGITSVWCEEATELNELDFNQLELRVRGETTNYKQYMVTFNPIDENHWLKSRFFDSYDDQTMLMTTTYKDNPFLDDDYIRHLEQRVSINENLYKIYVLGEWGRATVGGEFYKNFKWSLHVKDTAYNPELPLHISFDFNVNPYMSCGVFQIEGLKISMVDEIALSTPRNSTKAVCLEFIRKYQGHSSGLFIYGDPSGRHQDTRSEQGFNDFVLIQRELIKYKPNMRVQNSAPSVVMRGNFINTVFEQSFEGIEVAIGANCKHMIDDFTYLKEASDGTKSKEKEKNLQTGVTCEKYGHFSDLFDYIFCTVFEKQYKSYQSGGVVHKFVGVSKIPLRGQFTM